MKAPAALAKFLHTAWSGDRRIDFAVAGAEDGEPVLLFYPMGSCRSLAALFDWPAKQERVKLICVNRPGMGCTSPAPGPETQLHVKASCQDAVAVLDFLEIARVSLLFFCAGTPFALGFQARHPDRSTCRVVGCSAWASPVDCPGARMLFRLGAALPTAFLAMAARLMASCLRSLGPDLPGPGLTDQEAELLCPLPGSEAEQLVTWLLDPHTTCESGGEGADAAALVEGASAWGLDYGALGAPVVLLHGEEDSTVPMNCAEWLWAQLPAGSTLLMAPGADHGDVMLLGIRSALRCCMKEMILSPRTPGTPGGRRAGLRASESREDRAWRQPMQSH